MARILTIDGSRGEGGGQVLRTALSLSVVTGTPFSIERIRARRKKPGLMRQHLTAVRAAAAVGGAEVTGAALRSQELTFVPAGVYPGKHHFAVGTAGSACLVLQAVLPPLLCAGGPSTLVLEGGTHNQHAPPFDFVERCTLPLLARLGAAVRARLDRPGFFPAGGGRIVVEVEPCPALRPLELLDAGPVVRRRARAWVSRLSVGIARRELAVVRAELGWTEEECEAVEVPRPRGPGNVLCLEVERSAVTQVFSAFGRRGLPAERVAAAAVEQARPHLERDVPVDEHLADQLLLPLALAGGGRFRTRPLTEHARTNREVIRRFLDVGIEVEEDGPDVVVAVTGPPPRLPGGIADGAEAAVDRWRASWSKVEDEADAAPGCGTLAKGGRCRAGRRSGGDVSYRRPDGPTARSKRPSTSLCSANPRGRTRARTALEP